MPHTIDLSKPLLEQTTVREMLGLSMTEETPKIGLDDLIKVAVDLVKTELADCNCNEDELVSLQLEYTLPHPTKPNLIETSVLHWKQQPLEQLSDTQKDEVEKLPDEESEIELQKASAQKPSKEFLSRLAERINEAVFVAQPRAFKSSISWGFGEELEPDEKYGECGDHGCPGDHLAIVRKDNGIFVRCGGSCGSTQMPRQE